MPMIRRTLTVTAAVAALAFGSVGPATAASYHSPEQRIYTLAQQPERCFGGTIDVAMFRSDLYPAEMQANFTTHLYSPAWSGSASYECFVTITADWKNHATGDTGTVSHEVASWRFQGPQVRNRYLNFDIGEGPVTISFRTNMPHTPSPTFEVPAT